MIDDNRLVELQDNPSQATESDVLEMCKEIQRSRPVIEFVHETLKAIYINAKEAANRSLELDVITSASRQAMKRIKASRHSRR